MAPDKKTPTRPQRDEQRKDERTERPDERNFERDESNRNDEPGVQKLGKAH